MLVVGGSDDRLMPPRHAEELAKAIPGAALVVVPGAGHLVHLEAAEHLPGAAEQAGKDEGREVPDGFFRTEFPQAAAGEGSLWRGRMASQAFNATGVID